MKKMIASFLALCLLVTGFAGCTKNIDTNIPKETQTDASGLAHSQQINETESIVSVVVPMESSPIESEQETDAASEPEKLKEKTNEKKEDAVISQPDTAAEQTVDTSEVSKPSENHDNRGQTYGDAVREYPNFYTEDLMRSWLLESNTGYFEQDQSQVLNALTSGNAVRYFRPVLADGNDTFSLDQIKIHTPSGGFTYWYNYEKDACELKVLVGYARAEEGLGGLYEGMRSKYEKNEPGFYYANVGGIDYYYTYVQSRDLSLIYWQQFGLTHVADLVGHFDQIEEILPLIKLEQVTLRTDTVTE